MVQNKTNKKSQIELKGKNPILMKKPDNTFLYGSLCVKRLVNFLSFSFPLPQECMIHPHVVKITSVGLLPERQLQIICFLHYCYYGNTMLLLSYCSHWQNNEA